MSVLTLLEPRAAPAGIEASWAASEEIVAVIARSLELQAVWVGEQPQAFINNKLVTAGDILKVDSGDGTYECEVVEIEENRVHMQCGEVKVILKLKGALK